MRSDLCDITLAQHHETDRAYLVSEDGEHENAIWLPKSLVERDPDSVAKVKPGLWSYTYTMPERLAHQKGLI